MPVIGVLRKQTKGVLMPAFRRMTLISHLTLTTGTDLFTADLFASDKQRIIGKTTPASL
jgi:hypothetical protein